MLIPVIIFAVCFGLGAAAAGRWLPDLGPGRVAGGAFLAVSGLLGGAVAVIGLQVYSLVHQLDATSYRFSLGEVIAGDLRVMLVEAGTLLGLATIAFLLAPQSRHEQTASRAREASLPETD